MQRHDSTMFFIIVFPTVQKFTINGRNKSCTPCILVSANTTNYTSNRAMKRRSNRRQFPVLSCSHRKPFPIHSHRWMLLQPLFLPRKRPSWLSAFDWNYYVREFQRSGFHGGLAWYKAADRNADEMRELMKEKGDHIRIPALFLIRS